MHLLPHPRILEPREGSFSLPTSPRLIHLSGSRAPELLSAAKVLQRAAEDSTGQPWEIAASNSPLPQAAITLLVENRQKESQPLGYVLLVQPHRGLSIVATDPAMAFYGAHTAAQLLRQFPREIPALHIEDSPDFPVRGVMLDISRDKVPSMHTLFSLVDLFASLKINQLQLYTEHTFAYRNHPDVWATASPMTGAEIMELDHYCRERFIELVPNQNSFGHMERWLKHPRYAPLAEAPDGFVYPWGRRSDIPTTLHPAHPESLHLVESLYDELLPHFTSHLFNVGCDETWELGEGKSKEDCERRGKERVYLDFLLKIHQLVQSRGKTMQFWGDIILHQPDLISELPKDVIALEWGYEADHPFDHDGSLFEQANIPFYVCPGTSSWCSFSGRTDNALTNLKSAAEGGLKHGAIGYLNTDWGDFGHLQYLSTSYLPFAAGAALSWCSAQNERIESLLSAVNLHVFKDCSGVMAQVMHDLGNVYRVFKKQRNNSTMPFWTLVGDDSRRNEFAGCTAAEYGECLQQVDLAIHRLRDARMSLPDGSLILDEVDNTAAMLRHACRRGEWLIDPSSHPDDSLAADLRHIIGRHRDLWIARNRVGGLSDSSRRLEERLAEYRP